VGTGGVPIDVVIKPGVLAPQPLQHRFFRFGWGSLAHRTSVPFVWSCSRIARFGSAYFVVARRGKAPLLPPPQHGERAISDARS
jgi:hypothetical protein